MRESEITQSCPTLSDLMDCSLPGSSIHGIFQARVLEWGAIAFSRGWSTSLKSQSENGRTGVETRKPVSGTKVTSGTYAAVTGCPCWTWQGVFRGLGICGSPRKKSESEVTQSYPTLSNPMGCSLPGSSVHGSFQARVLEWVASAFSILQMATGLGFSFHSWSVFIPIPVKVAQLCPALGDPVDYTIWNSPGQNPGVGSLSLLQGWNPGLVHCGWILHQLNHRGSPEAVLKMCRLLHDCIHFTRGQGLSST